MSDFARTELAEVLSDSTGWEVIVDARRFTFATDDPPQTIIWTVSDSELGQLRFDANSAAKGFGGRRSAHASIASLGMLVQEAIASFDGARGEIHGTDLGTIIE